MPLLPLSRPGSVISLSEQEKQRWFYGYTSIPKEFNEVKEFSKIEETNENLKNNLPLKLPTLNFSNGKTSM